MHERPDNFPPAPAHQCLSVKRRRDGSFTPFFIFIPHNALIQSQHTAKLRQIFRQRSNRSFQCIPVGIGQFVVGFKTVFSTVFRQNGIDLLKLASTFANSSGLVFAVRWTQRIDNFLRAFNVSPEIPQIGVAVAIFFTADFAGCHFPQSVRLHRRPLLKVGKPVH